MTKAELMSFVGENVEITFYDGSKVSGKLEWVDAFSEKFDYSKPQRFKVREYVFRVSHVKKLSKGKSNP